MSDVRQLYMKGPSVVAWSAGTQGQRMRFSRDKATHIFGWTENVKMLPFLVFQENDEACLTYTPCLKKNCTNCFGQNFVKFPSILIIFSR